MGRNLRTVPESRNSRSLAALVMTNQSESRFVVPTTANCGRRGAPGFGGDASGTDGSSDPAVKRNDHNLAFVESDFPFLETVLAEP